MRAGFGKRHKFAPRPAARNHAPRRRPPASVTAAFSQTRTRHTSRKRLASHEGHGDTELGSSVSSVPSV